MAGVSWGPNGHIYEGLYEPLMRWEFWGFHRGGSALYQVYKNTRDYYWIRRKVADIHHVWNLDFIQPLYDFTYLPVIFALLTFCYVWFIMCIIYRLHYFTVLVFLFWFVYERLHVPIFYFNSASLGEHNRGCSNLDTTTNTIDEYWILSGSQIHILSYTIHTAQRFLPLIL